MNYQNKALNEAQELVNETSEIPEEKRKVLKEKLEAARPLDSDKMIYRMVVGALGLAILFCLVFTFVLMLQRNGVTPREGVTIPELKIPEIFTAIGSAAVGALAGLLAPSPASRN